MPAWDAPSVLAALTTSLARADHVQAAVAFWTVSGGLFAGTIGGKGRALARPLQEVLKHEDSFLAVDVHLPTDIDVLASLAASGANVRIYAEEIPTYTANGRKEPPALLHAKMLLFSLKDGTAELWVGSHNWTNRAILGLNIEASLVVILSAGSPLLAEASAYLERVRSISSAFDPSQADFYKQLQRPASVDITHVIELEADGAEAFAGEVIALFGTDAQDLDELGTVGRNLHVSLSRPDSHDEYLYPATILHAGRLAANDFAAGGVSFSPRRHAFRQGRKFPVVRPEGPIDADVLNQAAYFVTLHLASINWSVVAEPVAPRASAWSEMEGNSSPLLDRLDGTTQSILFQGRTPRVKRPRTEAWPAEPDSLLERKQLPDRGLIAKRVLRRREMI